MVTRVYLPVSVVILVLRMSAYFKTQGNLQDAVAASLQIVLKEAPE